jgi:hypothetical protein
MAALLTILVFTLDPIRVFITVLFLVFARRPWMVFVAAGLSTVICETLLVALQTTWVWGEGLAVGGIASLVQSVILFWMGSAVRNWLTNRPSPFQFPFRIQ